MPQPTFAEMNQNRHQRELHWIKQIVHHLEGRLIQTKRHARGKTEHGRGAENRKQPSAAPTVKLSASFPGEAPCRSWPARGAMILLRIQPGFA